MTTHLAPDIAALLSQSKEDRCAMVLADRFIQHERLKPVIDHIDYLRFMPQKSRAEGLLVCGPPGTGKSMLLRHIERKYPRERPEGRTKTEMPFVTIEMTGAREAKVLYERILAKLGDPDPCRHSSSARERMLLKLATAANLKLLAADEIQDVLTSTSRQQRFALDAIKFLMNELHIPILLMGTEEAPDALCIDKHLNARFEVRQLPVWKADAFLSNFLHVLERNLPLSKASHLGSPTLMATIIQCSGGSLDAIVRLVTRAASFAILEGGEQITETLLRKAKEWVPAGAVEKGRQQFASRRAA